MTATRAARPHTQQLRAELDALRLRYQELTDTLASVPVSLYWVAPGGSLLWANQAALDLLGCVPEDFVGRHMADFHADPDVAADILAHLARGEPLRQYPARLRCQDGTIKHVLISASAVWDDGRVVRAQCSAVDVTDQVRAEEEARRQAHRLAILANTTSEVLAASLDYTTTLTNIARLAVPAFADWCIVDVLASDAIIGTAPGHQPRIERVAVAAADPHKQAVLEDLRQRYSPTWDSPQPAARALRTGRPAFFPSFTGEMLAQTARDEAHLALLRALAPTSAIAVPMVAHGHTLGAITFAWAESGRHYSPADIELAEEIARRCALAIEHARLFQEVREREEAYGALNSALREVAEARDRALAEAEAERRRLRDLFVQAPAFLAVLRGPDHIYEFANPPYVRLMGQRDAAALLGKPVRDTLATGVPESYLALLDQVYQTGESYVGHEVRVPIDRSGDGTLDEAFLNVVLQPYRTADGRIDGVLVYGVDVTEQVRARRQIEKLARQAGSRRPPRHQR
jgi:PAS domain S-box-containing protein